MKWREKRIVTKKNKKIIESRHNKEKKETRKETEEEKLAMTQDNASYEVYGKKRRCGKEMAKRGETRRWQGGNA